MSRRANDRTPKNRRVDDRTSIMMFGLIILIFLSIKLKDFFLKLVIQPESQLILGVQSHRPLTQVSFKAWT